MVFRRAAPVPWDGRSRGDDAIDTRLDEACQFWRKLLRRKPKQLRLQHADDICRGSACANGVRKHRGHELAARRSGHLDRDLCRESDVLSTAPIMVVDDR